MNFAVEKHNVSIGLAETLFMTRAKRRVLLVEDSPADAEIARDELESGGYTVSVADSGKAALSMAETAQQGGNQYEIAVVDLILQDVTGISVASHLKVSYPVMIILMCSGVLNPGETAIIEDALKQGFIIVPKPIRLKNIMQVSKTCQPA